MSNGYLGGGGFDPSGYMMRMLMKELFKDNTGEYQAEASTMGVLAKNASTQEEFNTLSKLLPEYYDRNDSHGPNIEALETKIKSDFTTRRRDFNKFKEAHPQAIAMTQSDYLVSATDKDGGIQNITKEDILGWDHKRLTEELL